MKFKRKISLMLAGAVVLSSMASFSSLSQNVSAEETPQTKEKPVPSSNARIAENGDYLSWDNGAANDGIPGNETEHFELRYGFNSQNGMSPYVYRYEAYDELGDNPSNPAYVHNGGELHYIFSSETYGTSNTGLFIGDTLANASAQNTNFMANISGVGSSVTWTAEGTADNNALYAGSTPTPTHDGQLGIDGTTVDNSNPNETIWRSANITVAGVDGATGTADDLKATIKISLYPTTNDQIVYQYDVTNTNATADEYIGMVVGFDTMLWDNNGTETVDPDDYDDNNDGDLIDNDNDGIYEGIDTDADGDYEYYEDYDDLDRPNGFDSVPLYMLPDHKGFYAESNMKLPHPFPPALPDYQTQPLNGKFIVSPYGGALTGLPDDPATQTVDESLVVNPGPEVGTGQNGIGTGPNNWVAGDWSPLGYGFSTPFGGSTYFPNDSGTTTGFADGSDPDTIGGNDMDGVGHEIHTMGAGQADPEAYLATHPIAKGVDSAFNLKWQPTKVAPGATKTMTWAIGLEPPGNPPVIDDIINTTTGTSIYPPNTQPEDFATAFTGAPIEILIGEPLPLQVNWHDLDSNKVNITMSLTGTANRIIDFDGTANSFGIINAHPGASTSTVTPFAQLPASTLAGPYTCTITVSDPENHTSNKAIFKLDIINGTKVTTDNVEVLEVINTSATLPSTTYTAEVILNGNIVEGDYSVAQGDYGFLYTSNPNINLTDYPANGLTPIDGDDFVTAGVHPDMQAKVTIPIQSPTDSVRIVAYAKTTTGGDRYAYGNEVVLDADSLNDLTVTPKVYGVTRANTAGSNEPADTNHPNPYIELTGTVENLATTATVKESGFVYSKNTAPAAVDTLTLGNVDSSTIYKIMSTPVAVPSVGATWTAELTAGLQPNDIFYVRSYVIEDNAGMVNDIVSYGNLEAVTYDPNKVKITYEYIDSDTGLPITPTPTQPTQLIPTQPPASTPSMPTDVPIGGSSGVIAQPPLTGYTFDPAHPSTHPGFQNMTAAQTVTFYYKSDDTINVTFEYINAGPNGSVLGLPAPGQLIPLSPPPIQPMTIRKGSALQPQTAPIIPGYDVLAPTQLPPTTISGAATQNDITITFNYKPRISSVAVQCYVGTPAVPSTVPVPGYTPVTIDALAGVPYTATAPVIPGYTLQGAVPTNGALSSVSMSTNTIKFYYLSDGTTPPPVTGGTTPPPVTGGGGGTTPPPVTGGGGGGIPGTGGTGGGGGGIPGTGGTGGGGGGIPGTGGTGGGGGGIPGTGSTGGGGGGIPGTGSTGGGGGISPDFWNISGGGGIPTASNSNGGGGGTPSGGSSNGGGGISPDFWNISGGGGTPTASNSNGGGGTPSGGSSNGGGGTTSGSNSNGGGTSPDFWGISGGGGIPSATNSNGGGGTPGGTGLTGGTLAVNIDTDGNGTPDINIDTDGNGTPDVNIDTNGNKIPDVNVDTDGNGTPDVNIDTNGNRIPDLNVDTDGNGTPDLNVDTDGNKIPNINVDTDGDGTPDINIDTNGNKIPDVNIDTDGNGKPDLNIDTNGNKIPDVNVDTDGDGKPDVNIDTDGNGKPDLNIDTNGDGKPDVNIDTNGDGKPDVNIDTNANVTPNVSNVGGSTSSTSTATNGTDVPNVPTGAPFGVVAACAILALAGGTLIITRRKK